MSNPSRRRQAGWHHNRDTRIRELHRRLTKGRLVDPRLVARDFDVDERTIRRDLLHMRDKKGLPLARQPNGVWRYSADTVIDIPATTISNEDRFPLLIALQFTEQFRGTQWHRKLESAFKRLLDTLHPERNTDWKIDSGEIRFEGMMQSPVLPKLWDILCNSLESSETIKITYRTGSGAGTKARLLDPYGLIVRNREWYVVGWDHSHKTIRTFFLPRIHSAEYTDKQFAILNSFNLDTYLATSVDAHQSNQEAVNVTVRFTQSASAAAEDFIWTRNERKSHDEAGRLIVQFTTGALFAVERQVLSWGGGVEVLSPKNLRDSVYAAATSVCKSRNLNRPEFPTRLPQLSRGFAPRREIASKASFSPAGF